ncbi:hypothetical protein EJB05_39182, partial [Eragrostis curvula]
MTKQKIVIRVSMSCEKSRSKAMALVGWPEQTVCVPSFNTRDIHFSFGFDMANANSASRISVGITGDGKDRLEMVGDGVDTVCLVQRLRKKIGQTEILQVEEVKDKKPEEKKKPEEPKVLELLPYYYHPGYHYHPWW